MKQLAFIILTATSALAAAAAPALAADLCIDSVLFSPEQLVGKNFKVPGKNTCKPFHGFFTADVSPGGEWSSARVVRRPTGRSSACTSVTPQTWTPPPPRPVASCSPR